MLRNRAPLDEREAQIRLGILIAVLRSIMNSFLASPISHLLICGREELLTSGKMGMIGNPD